MKWNEVQPGDLFVYWRSDEQQFFLIIEDDTIHKLGSEARIPCYNFELSCLDHFVVYRYGYNDISFGQIIRDGEIIYDNRGD